MPINVLTMIELQVCVSQRERGQEPLFSTAHFLFAFPEGFKFASTLIVRVGPSGYIQSHSATWLWRKHPNGNAECVTNTSSGGRVDKNS